MATEYEDTEAEREEKRIQATLEAKLNKAPSRASAFRSSKVQPQTPPVTTSPTPSSPKPKQVPLVNEETVRAAAFRQQQMEEEREAQLKADLALRAKATAIPRTDELTIDRYLNSASQKREGGKYNKSSSSSEDEDEEERERVRLLRSVSGRGLFQGGGQAFKKKSLKELEEDRIAWREREEAKRQNEAEERRRKQEALLRRNQEEHLYLQRERAEKDRLEEQERDEWAQSHKEREAAERETRDREHREREHREAELRKQLEHERRLEQEARQRLREEEEEIAQLQREEEERLQQQEALERIEREQAELEQRYREAQEREEALLRAQKQREEQQRLERLHQEREREREAIERREREEEEAYERKQRDAAERHEQERLEREAQLPSLPKTSPEELLDGLVERLDAVTASARSDEAAELVKKLNQLRELLPYYKDQPSVGDVGHFLADFARVLAFLRGSVYAYPPDTVNLSEQFDYDTFTDAISGFIKFVLENLNFLTFEEDRAKILKGCDAVLQVAIIFINEIRRATTVSPVLAGYQSRWEKLCRLVFDYTLSGASTKSTVEEAREKSRRKLTTTILKLQVISGHLFELLSNTGEHFDKESFSVLFRAMTTLLGSIHEDVGEDQQQVRDVTRKILQVAASVAHSQASESRERILLEKYLVLAVHTLLAIRNTI